MVNQKYNAAKLERLTSIEDIELPVQSTMTITADQVLEGITTDNAKKLSKEGLSHEAWEAYQILNFPQWQIIALRKPHNK